MMHNPEASSPTSQGRVLRALGVVLALGALGLWATTVAREWDVILDGLQQADLGLLVAALALSALAMWFLALLWHQCLRTLGSPVVLEDATSWYFAGELGKYLPGGIWAVAGRAELARRRRVPRSLGYAATVLSLMLMCVGGALVMGVFLLFAAASGAVPGRELTLLLIIPIGVTAAHPAVFGRVLGFGHTLSRGRLSLTAPSWGRMLLLVLLATPTWLLVGLGSALIVKALGYGQSPTRVATAAVAAWLVGFLFVPVPAGAGIREVVFIALCGLASGPGAAVAGLARVNFLLVDGIGGGAALWREHRVSRRARRTADAAAEGPIRPADGIHESEDLP